MIRRASRSGRTVHSRVEVARRDGRGFSLAQLLDHVQHFLLGEDAFALQQLHQSRGLPHGGEGQFFDGHEVVGVEMFSSSRWLAITDHSLAALYAINQLV